ncbi:MAG: TetR/AcrR family transcriptional regulator [Chloroflexota bacterium]|nr:TetR/AcrR family transcriptional regulator [Chloroflexota bacterium]
MTQETTDRRSRRSRRLILDAMLALMMEKRYDRITVQGIIDRADVGRSTFYARFRNKDDVLMSEFGHVLRLLQAPPPAPGQEPADLIVPSLEFFRHVHEQRWLYPALVRAQGIDLIQHAVHRYLREHAEHQLAMLAVDRGKLAVPPDLIADYVASVLMVLVRWWLEQPAAYSPEQIDEMFRQLVMPGIQRLLRDAGVSSVGDSTRAADADRP